MPQLTEHFSYEELIHSDTADKAGLPNVAPDELMPNAYRLAKVLETVRDLAGQPIHVTSGYRCPRLNVMVGGSATSAHMRFLAADIHADLHSADDLFDKIAKSSIVFDQLIIEKSRDGAEWVHIGLADDGKQPRRELLKADGERGHMAYHRVFEG